MDNDLNESLVELVSLLVEKKIREADVSDGSKVPVGSTKHIKDLEVRIADLSKWRDKSTRGSETRANYARVVARLKAELRSAKRAVEKKKAKLRMIHQFVDELLSEGGAVGHLAHLFDNRELTFAEIKELLTSAAEGQLENVSEKLDGMNLVFSWDVSANDLRVARNSGDIKSGGLDETAIAKKFQDRGNVADAFNSAFKVLRDALSSLSDSVKLKIFGETATIWYSMEVIYTSNPNVINYDSNNIVFHGWPVFEISNGVITKKDDPVGIDLLKKNIEQMQKAVTVRNWHVKGPALLRLKKLSDGSILQKTLATISNAQHTAGISDANTMNDYLQSMMTEKAMELNIPDAAISSVVSRCLSSPGTPNLVAIKKLLSPDQHVLVSKFVKDAPVHIKRFVQPIEDAIHHFAIEVLRGLQSTLINDNDAEILRLRAETTKAITAIESSGQDAAMEILRRQMEKLQSIENIASAMEGVVFIYKGNAYKFTGGFAPANQILGLFKYGRGSVKIQPTTESILRRYIRDLIHE